MSVRYEEVRRVLVALDSIPPAEQADALIALCGEDRELRSEVESLLRADSSLDSDLAATAGGARAIAGLVTSALPEYIGPYRVLGLLGHGGMGEVFHAEQLAPIHREVAIKRALDRRDAGQVLARFEFERQTLAELEHPGIARVYDAGTDVDGAPYFVMELVRGEPLTEFVARRRLGLDERLRLFRQACQAVQHAHQKGILHRDLKPSNLLVTEENGVAQLKVIDFGIAKPLDAGRRGELTAAGQILGTIEFMSPERLAGSTGSDDTRSDVYSLGVVLHELVTGAPLHDVRGLDLMEAMRLIRDGGAATTAPPAGGAGLDPGLDADLRLICRKAVARDPGERYPSAAALAQDLERWEGNLPILARAPSTTYLLRKLVSRNRVPTALAALLCLLVVGSAITLGALYQDQRRAREQAESEADKARAVSRFLSDMLGGVQGQGREVKLRDVIDAATRGVERELGDQPEVEASTRGALGVAYTALGDFDQADRQLRRSIALRDSILGSDHQDLAETLGSLAELERTRRRDRVGFAIADSIAQRAYEINVAALGPSDRRTLLSLGQLAGFRRALGQREADSLYASAIRAAESRFGGEDILVAGLLADRSDCAFNSGDRAGARAMLERALEIYRKHLSGDHVDIADCLHHMTFLGKDVAETDSLTTEYLAMMRRLWGDGDLHLCSALEMTAGRLREQLRHEEALKLLRESMAIRLRYFPEDDAQVAGSRNSLGVALLDHGQFEEAIALLRPALAIWEQKLGPSTTGAHICRTNLAVALSRAGRAEEGLDLLEAGLASLPTPHAEGGPSGLYHRRMAEVLLAMKRGKDAVTHARLAMDAFGKQNRGASSNRASAARVLGVALHEEGRCAEATRSYEIADSLFASLKVWSGWSATRIRWSECLLERGQVARADALLREADQALVETHGRRHIARLDLLIARAELAAKHGPTDSLATLLAEAGPLVPADDARRGRLAALVVE